MEHSKFQTAAFDWLANGEGSAVMSACAGGGKTYMIESMSRRITSGSQIMVPFNKHIAAELVKRGLPGRTLNSFGYEVLRNQGWRIKFDQGFKTLNLLKAYFNLDRAEEANKFFKVKHFVQRVVSLAKANMLFTVDALNDKYEWILEHYALEEPDMPESDLIHCVFTIYDWSLNDDYHIDFDDQLFKPLQHAMPIPKFDYVFIDEVQDLTMAGVELYLRMIGRRGIAVGDDEQSIYRFRGAEEGTLGRLRQRQDATWLPLSICYRCGTKIVEDASKYVPPDHILPWDKSPPGYVGHTDEIDFRTRHTVGDVVLSRCTAPLVKECIRDIKKGVPAYVAGKDLGQAIVDLLKKPAGNESHASIVDSLGRLHDWFAGEQERLNRLGREETLSLLEDKMDAIGFLTEGCRTVGDFESKIKLVFKDDGEGVVYRSIHKSKGLENWRIWTIGLDKLPHKKGYPPEEKRIQYVDATRAKEEHHYVESDSKHLGDAE